MAKKADISTKKLISLAPNNWVKWITQIPGIKAEEILDPQFQWVSRESDVLVRVKNSQNKPFLVLNEIQLRYKSNMPKRMRAYTGLAEEKYNLPVFPVLINLLNEGDKPVLDRYDSHFEGLYARQDYRVINLWEVDVELAFQQQIPSLLPFVPLLKDGGDETTIREALRLLRQDEELGKFETVLGFFASFILDQALVQQIMSWDMAVIQESPWYKQIVAESEQRGELRGEQRGEQRGKISLRLSDIETNLEAKFGDQGLELMPQISQISDLERLSAIFRCILASNSLEEVRGFLQE
jgi:predicted transposase YdaD